MFYGKVWTYFRGGKKKIKVFLDQNIWRNDCLEDINIILHDINPGI